MKLENFNEAREIIKQMQHTDSEIDSLLACIDFMDSQKEEIKCFISVKTESARGLQTRIIPLEARRAVVKCHQELKEKKERLMAEFKAL